MYPQYHPYLLAAAAPAAAVPPQDMRYLGYGLAALLAYKLYKTLFSSSSSD